MVAPLKRVRTNAGILAPSDPDVVRVLLGEADAHPEWPDLQNQAGLLLAAQGRFEEARTRFQDALYRNPRYAWASLNLAALHFGTGRWPDVIEQINCNPDPCSPARELTLGWIALLDGRPDDARRALEPLDQALAARPDVAWLLAAIAESQGAAHAEGAWTRVASDSIVERSPEEVEALRRVEEPRRLTGLFPGWHQLWFAASRAEARLGRFDEARRSARMGYLYFSRRELYLNQLAFIAQFEGREGDAVRHHEEAMRSAPDDPTAPAALARIWAARDEIDRAAEYLEHALRLAPRFADLLRLMGQLEFARDRNEEGLAYTRRALQANPRYELARVDEANALFRLGRWSEACDAYRWLLSAGISSSDILSHFARCLEEEDLREARAVYGEALRMNPREILAHYRLASVCRRLGDVHAADRHFGRALALTRDPDVWELMEPMLAHGPFADPDLPLAHRRAS